jgi:hypothetical protein
MTFEDNKEFSEETEEEDEDEQEDEVVELDSPEDSDVISYLLYICSYLIGTEFKNIEIQESLFELEDIMGYLQDLRKVYKREVPKSAESARDGMRKILRLLIYGTTEMIKFLDDRKEEHLELGMEYIEISERLINVLRDSISVNRMELTDLLNWLKTGAIKEGQPVLDNNSHMYNSEEIFDENLDSLSDDDLLSLNENDQYS